MNCAEVRELLPAYVLGVLDPADAQAVEAHLHAGREHDQELVELRATVLTMDRYADEPLPTPSAELAERVRAIAATPRSAPSSRSRWFLHWSMPRLTVTAVAAVVLLLVFGAGWLAGGAFHRDSDRSFAYVLQNRGGAEVALTGSTAADSVTVTMAGLERLPAGSAYQLWAVQEDGSWHTIGVCNTDEAGWWEGSFPYALHSVERIALTIEPTGGSARPTSQPILSSSF